MTKKDELRKDLNRISNTPSPNPRYGGLTVLETARQFLTGTRRPEIKPQSHA